jgi:hypothetical protein
MKFGHLFAATTASTQPSVREQVRARERREGDGRAREGCDYSPRSRNIPFRAARGGIGAAGANEAVTDDDDGDVCA